MQIWWYMVLFLMPFAGGMLGMRARKERVRELKIFLAFSGAFLISITLMNLVPEVYSHLGGKAGYFVLGGFFLQVITDYFSKGIEHGHIHLHEFQERFPISVFVALSFHALLEGVGIGGETFGRETMNNMVLAIGLHEIPAAFALAVILKSSKLRSNARNYLWVIVYALMVPLGLQIGHVLQPNEELIHAILGVVIGVFLHISTTILFENSERHAYGKYKLLAIAAGTSLALIAMNVHVH